MAWLTRICSHSPVIVEPSTYTELAEMPVYPRYVSEPSGELYALEEPERHPVVPLVSKARYALGELLDALTV
jgi:hypothetical protein